MNGRAETDDQKEMVMARILAAWKTQPSLRLGQLIWGSNHLRSGPDLFYVEDFKLVERIEDQVTTTTTTTKNA